MGRWGQKNESRARVAANYYQFHSQLASCHLWLFEGYFLYFFYGLVKQRDVELDYKHRVIGTQ